MQRRQIQIITRSVTHILLTSANADKLAALAALAEVYLALCRQYVTLFFTDGRPDKFRATRFPSPLPERWQRVAIQQAAGIAQSWRTNRARAYQDYLDFAFALLKHVCETHQTELLVMNTETLSPEAELVQDLITITHCFSSRLYGLRNYRKALEKALKDENRAQDQNEPHA